MVRYLSPLIILVLMSIKSSWANTNVPPLYQSVARTHGIPEKVLYILALGESQTRLQSGLVRPWPWTLNVKGKPYFYPNYEQACQALTQFLTQTERVDIGLTQHNWYWQKAHFSTPCEAFLPEKNLNHAAKLLIEGYVKHKDWVKAAGYFHRPAGGAPAKRYKATFASLLKKQGGAS